MRRSSFALVGALLVALGLTVTPASAQAASGGSDTAATTAGRGAAPTVVCTPTPPQGPATDPGNGGFHPITPTRVLDTRYTTGPVGAGCTAVIDTYGVLPAGATGAALDVVATEATDMGHVTVYPCGSALPPSSNLNPRVGDATANNVLVPLDATRRICLFSASQTQLVVDVTGWFGRGGRPFHGTDPARIVDTRQGTGMLAAGQILAVPVAGLAPVPAGAAAVAVNLTVTDTTAPGHLTAWPCGGPMPLASNVNYLAGDTRANQALVGLDANGLLCVSALVPVHLVIDVYGWFDGTGANRLYPVTAHRVVDSRNGTGGWATPIAAGETRSFDPSMGGTLPVGASAQLNVTTVDAEAPGWIVLYPCGATEPPASTANFVPGQVTANAATIQVGDGGLVCVHAAAGTNVVVDLFGSFGPSGPLRRLDVSPGNLQPTFVPTGHDYGVICAAGVNVLTVHVEPEPGSTAVVAGANQAGQVTMSENAVATITVSRPGRADEVYHLRCLPHDFPQLAANPLDDGTPGWYMVTTGLGAPPGATYAVILDSNGAAVWYRKTSVTVTDLKRLPNGHIMFMPTSGQGFGVDDNAGFAEQLIDGTPVHTWRTLGTPTDFHDADLLANGHMLLGSYHLRTAVDVSALGSDYTSPANVVDLWLQEVRADGSVAWEWHSEDHLAVAETTAHLDGLDLRNQYHPSGTVIDLVHANSWEVDPTTGDVLLSARHTDAVYRIRRNPGGGDDGTVLWKLGGNAPTDPATRHLTLVGDALGGPHRQHDARLLPNGHVTIFDNEYLRGGAVSRAVEYAVDAGAGTATLVWSTASPTNSAAWGLGSVRRQPDGGTTVGWGGSVPMVSDLAADGVTTLEVREQPSGWSYRAIKAPLVAFDAAQLRAGAG